MSARVSSLLRRGRRLGTRRVLVLTTLALTAFLASDLPGSLHGFGVVVVLVLAGLDVILIRSTVGVAFARTRSLDERQRALRDRAYRVGFRLLGLAFVLLLVTWILVPPLEAYISQGTSGPITAQLDSGVSGRTLVAIVELLLIMPTLVIAWSGPEPVADETTDRRSISTLRSKHSRTAWLVLPVIAAAWIGVGAATPVQTALASTNFTQGFEMSGATCRHFVAGRIIGAQFGATVGLRAEVCWNHTDAFVVGDPLFPLPQSALVGLGPPGVSPPPALSMDPSEFNRADPSLTECGGDSSDDFATLSSLRCTATIDSAGTLHYAVHAHVSALPFSIGARDITMALVVDRDGRILAQP